MTKTSRAAPEQQEHTNQENKEEETTNNRPYQRRNCVSHHHHFNAEIRITRVDLSLNAIGPPNSEHREVCTWPTLQGNI